MVSPQKGWSRVVATHTSAAWISSTSRSGATLGRNSTCAEPGLARAPLEPGLGHAVAHQQEAQVTARAQPLRGVEQHVHAVDQAVRARVQHGERLAGAHGPAPPGPGGTDRCRRRS